MNVYDETFFIPAGDFRRDDETIGFIGPLIAAAPSIFSTVMGLFGNKQTAQFQGLAGIQSGGQQLIQTLNQIKTNLQSGQMAPAQAVSEAQRIASTLQDPTIFYPAKKGNDAAALTQFKAQAAAMVQEIQSLAAAMAQAQQAAGIDPATGRPLSNAGISTNTLLIAALGIGGVLLLTNRGS
jgi:hypothetical protein